jgi:enoyl-CoA hydratase
MAQPPLEVTREGAIARLRFCRGEAANALGLPFWEAFPQAIAGLDQAGDVRALVIHGEGKHFCAGMDLAVFAAGTLRPEEGPAAREAFVHDIRRLQAALDCLARARFPVIAAIQGACLGAGLDLAAACDLRFAADDAYFRIEEINIGMMADLGSLQRLPRQMPDAILRHMAFCGATLGAAQAAAMGFVNGVSADPLEAAMDTARDIARRAPLAVTACKRAIAYAQEHGVADSLEHAAILQASAWCSADIKGAMAARAAKQDAEFSGLQDLRRE